MSILLLLIAAFLIWLGVDALLLARHSSTLPQIEQDEMMFGKMHKRPVSAFLRSFAERRYPFATSSSMQFYGYLFIVVGIFSGWLAWEMRE